MKLQVIINKDTGKRTYKINNLNVSQKSFQKYSKNVVLDYRETDKSDILEAII